MVRKGRERACAARPSKKTRRPQTSSAARKKQRVQSSHKPLEDLRRLPLELRDMIYKRIPHIEPEVGEYCSLWAFSRTSAAIRNDLCLKSSPACTHTKYKFECKYHWRDFDLYKYFCDMVSSCSDNYANMERLHVCVTGFQAHPNLEFILSYDREDEDICPAAFRITPLTYRRG